MPQTNTKKAEKRTQERSEQTQDSILAAATRLFSELGYDGVTVSDIEKLADVHRGLVAYHFSDKETLWKTVTDRSFNHMSGEFRQRLSMLKEVSKQERLALIVRFYVHFNAQHPEVSALVSQEARKKTWRNEYLVDHHVRRACDSMEALANEILGLDRETFIHWYYILISASSTLFYFAPECELLFGVDSRSEAVVQRHAELLVGMLANPKAPLS
ncbi:MAG: TetR family transcriptional regulator [Halioglobus sp.]